MQYKLFYKIFCFTNIYNLLIESLEAAFLFEQVTNDLWFITYVPIRQYYTGLTYIALTTQSGGPSERG